MRFQTVACALALLLAACESEGGGANQTTSAAECTAKLKWSGGDHGSQFMNPGKDCIACHKSKGEGPSFVVAGTVYAGLTDPDTCEGKSAITVEITGKDGKKTILTTNEAGNFMLEPQNGAIVFPFTAEIKYKGVSVGKMKTAVSEGSCNSCHKATDGTAPGRIVVIE